MNRLPTYSISHGGGPWPWIKDELPGDWSVLESSLAGIPDELPARPEAVLVVSAHWITSDFTVQTGSHPPMLYDYGGFPEFTYHLQYPAPGAPEVAARAAALLHDAGLPVGADEHRGFDHGVFAPLFVMYPDAAMPIAQMSIRRDFDPAAHIAAGRALAPLREEGVLIVGSGYPSFHDLRNLGPNSAVPSRAFDEWLTETLVQHVGDSRSRRLAAWSSAPQARRSHPREDHLIPTMVAAGAAHDDPGYRHYHDDGFMGFTTSSGYRFGHAAR